MSTPNQEPAGSERRGTRALVLGLAAAAIAIASFGQLSGGPGAAPGEATFQATSAPPSWLLPLDDAYIFVRYAQQAARGRPLQWTDGEVSTGASSLLFPWLLVPGQWVASDLAGWSWWSRAVGVLGLWLLGLAAAAFVSGLGLGRPWPLAGGLAVMAAGPVPFVTLAGMETAWACAAVLCVVTTWCRARGAERVRVAGWFLPLVAILPWIRPELAVLTMATAAGVLIGLLPGVARAHAFWLPLPGLAMALAYQALTGEAQPAGAISKSLTGTPFLDPGRAVVAYGHFLRTNVIPVYLGQSGSILPPGVGVLAILGALGALVLALRRPADAVWHPLRDAWPAALAWLAFFGLAPLSGYLFWQGMRHHHPGLVLSWLLGGVAVASIVEHLLRDAFVRRPALRAVAFLWPLAAAPALVTWVGHYGRAATELHAGNGRAAVWLADNQRDQVLLVNDAGLPAIAHDGPAIDFIGLGTPAFVRPFRHGPGSVAETLARFRPLPEIASLNVHLVRIPGLLGDALAPLPPLAPGAEDRRLVVAQVRGEVLRDTVVQGAGVDFADLASEAAAHARFDPPPPADFASVAFTLDGPSGRATLHGCRPIEGRASVELPGSGEVLRLQATGRPDAVARLALGRQGEDAPLATLQVPARATAWSVLDIEGVTGESFWLANAGGLPCVESLAWRSGSAP